MTRVCLIRHGEAAGNRERLYLGQSDPPLTAHGRRQAQDLARLLRDVPLAAVYSSDLRRARQTATAVARLHGLPVQAVETLREGDFGLWTGLDWQAIARAWPQEWEAWLADPERVAPPGGETAGAIRRRALGALERIAGYCAGQSVAVVTHGGVLAVLLAGWLGCGLGEALAPPAGLRWVRRGSAGWEVVS